MCSKLNPSWKDFVASEDYCSIVENTYTQSALTDSMFNSIQFSSISIVTNQIKRHLKEL